jgi:hypothetical protein
LETLGSLTAGGFGITVMFRLMLTVSILCDGISLILSCTAAYLLSAYINREDEEEGNDNDDVYDDENSDSGSESYYSSGSDTSGSDDDDDDDDDENDNDSVDSDEKNIRHTTKYRDEEEEEEDDDEEYGGSSGSTRSSHSTKKSKIRQVRVGKGVEVPDLDDGYDDYIYTFEGGDYEVRTGSGPSPSVRSSSTSTRSSSQQQQQQQGYHSARRPDSSRPKGTMGFADPAYQLQQQQQQQQQQQFVPPPPPLPPQFQQQQQPSYSYAQQPPSIPYYDESALQYDDSNSGGYSSAYYDESGNVSAGYYGQQGYDSAGGYYDEYGGYTDAEGYYHEPGSYNNEETHYEEEEEEEEEDKEVTSAPLTARDQVRASTASLGSSRSHTGPSSSSSISSNKEERGGGGDFSSPLASARDQIRASLMSNKTPPSSSSSASASISTTSAKEHVRSLHVPSTARNYPAEDHHKGDDGVMTPQQFSVQWGAMNKVRNFSVPIQQQHHTKAGSQLFDLVNKNDLIGMGEFMKQHLESKGFVIVASGQKNGCSKLYAYIVDTSSSHYSQSSSIIFLLELVLIVETFEISATYKCESDHFMSWVVENMQFDQL